MVGRPVTDKSPHIPLCVTSSDYRKGHKAGLKHASESSRYGFVVPDTGIGRFLPPLGKDIENLLSGFAFEEIETVTKIRDELAKLPEADRRHALHKIKRHIERDLRDISIHQISAHYRPNIASRKNNRDDMWFLSLFLNSLTMRARCW